MKKKIVSALFALYFGVAYTQGVQAQDQTQADRFTQLAEEFQEELGEPKTGKRGDFLKSYLAQESQEEITFFTDQQIAWECDHQVLALTLPMASLFAPNDSLLHSTQDKKQLHAILTLMQVEKIDLLIASHWDNQGSERYKLKITEQRAQAVQAWLIEQGINPKSISTYAFSDREPLATNDTMAGRTQNKRLTFYFIPNKKLLTQSLIHQFTPWKK